MTREDEIVIRCALELAAQALSGEARIVPVTELSGEERDRNEALLRSIWQLIEVDTCVLASAP